MVTKNSKKNNTLKSRLRWWLGLFIYATAAFAIFVAGSLVTWYYYAPYVEVFWVWVYLGVSTTGYIIGLIAGVLDIWLEITEKKERAEREAWAKECERRKKLGPGRPTGVQMFG